MSHQQDPYLFHYACGVDNSTSIAVVGQMTETEIDFLKGVNFDLDTIGWPSNFDEADYQLNEIFPINLQQAVLEDDFVKFGYCGLRVEKDQISKIVTDRFGDLSHYIEQHGSFASYFAHLHSDKETSKNRGQVNLIIDNPLGHCIISKSSDGQYHKIIPKKGDIVLLDIHCEHAVLPNESHGYDKMRENPLVAVFVS